LRGVLIFVVFSVFLSSGKNIITIKLKNIPIIPIVMLGNIYGYLYNMLSLDIVPNISVYYGLDNNPPIILPITKPKLLKLLK
jgi:hypothetical protein